MAPKGSALRSRSSSTSSRNRGSVANASAKSSRTSANNRSRSSKTGTTSEASARENDEGVQMAKAATRLQALVRGFLARRSCSGREVVPMADKGAWFTTVADDAEARKAAEREMEEAVHAAEVMAFRAEMRQAEVKRQQELEKWRQKRELEKQTAKFVAAAFDGDVDQVKALLSWGVPIDGRSHSTTGLSEAACAGVSEIVKLLLDLRADPNIQGEAGRTAVWRAGYQGHLEIVSVLLNGGADPRIANEINELPVDVATSPDVLHVLRTWDIAQTEKLVRDYHVWSQEQKMAVEQKQAEALASVGAEVEDARLAWIMCQKALCHRKAALRRRILEHDLCMAQEKPESEMELIRKSCESAEAQIAQAMSECASAQARLDSANVKRMHAAEKIGADVGDSAVGRPINFKDLNDISVRDIGDRIAAAEKWPMVLDTNDCAMKFLQYSGSSVLNFWCPHEMHPDFIRRALLSMLRAGGLLVMNLLLFGAGCSVADIAEPFNGVRPGLFGTLLSRRLLAPDPDDPSGNPYFLSLLDKSKDGGRFDASQFVPDRMVKFKLAVLTSSTLPHEELQQTFDTMRVVLKPDQSESH